MAEIDSRLETVRVQESARISLAVESGSRAWGFPSPDSDYDCRFIYIRRLSDYLALSPMRDVIETPLDKVLDVNGWDLAKALRLLLKGNAVVIEWLTSPYIYQADERFREECIALAHEIVNPAAIAKHYRHLGEKAQRAHFNGEQLVSLKKVFYVLRPAMALRWLRLHSKEGVAPMNFQALMTESDVPAAIIEILDDLLARKAITRELGKGVIPAEVSAFAESEFAFAQKIWPDRNCQPSPEAAELANAFFQSWVITGS